MLATTGQLFKQFARGTCKSGHCLRGSPPRVHLILSANVPLAARQSVNSAGGVMKFIGTPSPWAPNAYFSQRNAGLSELCIRFYTRQQLRPADIGANLTDGMFQGQYMGKEYHPPDLPHVLERAWSAGTTEGTRTHTLITRAYPGTSSYSVV